MGYRGQPVQEQLLAGKGRLLAFVTTHYANQRHISVPFTVASIALEDGPVIRALMSEPTDDALHVNDPVEAILVDGGKHGHELRFQPAEEH